MTEIERARRALSSQGWAWAKADSLQPDEVSQLAALVDDEGRALPGIVQEFEKFRTDYYERRKAASD